MYKPFDEVWSKTPKEGFLPIKEGKHGYIHESVARAAYESYGSKQQSFERLYERGGFSAIELIYYLYQHVLDFREEITV